MFAVIVLLFLAGSVPASATGDHNSLLQTKPAHNDTQPEQRQIHHNQYHSSAAVKKQKALDYAALYVENTLFKSSFAMTAVNVNFLTTYSFEKILQAVEGIGDEDYAAVGDYFHSLNEVKTTEWAYLGKTDCTCDSTEGCGASPSFCGFVMNYMARLDLKCEVTFSNRSGMGCPTGGTFRRNPMNQGGNREVTRTQVTDPGAVDLYVENTLFTTSFTMTAQNDNFLATYSYEKILNAVMGIGDEDYTGVADNVDSLNEVKNIEWAYLDTTDCTCDSTAGCGASPNFCGFVMGYMAMLNLQCEETFSNRTAGMGCPTSGTFRRNPMNQGGNP